jgi:hypothetical protein
MPFQGLMPVALSGLQNLRKYSAELPRQAGAGIAVILCFINLPISFF